MLALMFFKNINSYINRFPTKPSKGLQNERCLGNSNLRNTKSTGNPVLFCSGGDDGIRPAVVHERQPVALQVAEERSDERTVRGQEQPVERIPLGFESPRFQ